MIRDDILLGNSSFATGSTLATEMLGWRVMPSASAKYWDNRHVRGCVD